MLDDYAKWEPKMTDIWFPIVEANQGFLSLIALAVSVIAVVVSLALALMEQRRANRVDIRQHRKAIGFAISLLLGFMDATSEAYADKRQTGPTLKKLRGEAELRARAFQALATSNPPDGRFAVLAIEAARALERISDRLNHQGLDQSFFAEIELELGKIRRSFHDNDPEAPTPVVDPRDIFTTPHSE